VNLSDFSVAAEATLRVRRYQESDREAWARFVEDCPEATFFHRIEWKHIIEETFRHRTHYLLVERGGHIVGVLPLAEIRSRLFGHSLVSLPFAVYGGAASTAPEATSALHAHAAELARELQVDHLELRNRARREPAWPEQDLYVTFRRSIVADDDANLKAIPRKQRAMVRKGMQRQLASEIDAGVDRFYALYTDNMHRHGTPPFSKRYFEALRAQFGDSCEVLTVLDPQGRPVSGVVSFYFRDEVLPYYAGDLDSARELAANDFKYWELMRRAGGRGVRMFDFGRSKRETGSFDFKKNWGFEPEPLHYEYQLLRRDSIPQNNPANPKYQAFIALWQKLPRPIVNALGPAIVRNLG